MLRTARGRQCEDGETALMLVMHSFIALLSQPHSHRDDFACNYRLSSAFFIAFEVRMLARRAQVAAPCAVG